MRKEEYMKILVFNPSTNKMEKYYRSLSQNMPYANNLTVKEFRGSSKSDVIWTDKRLMQAINFEVHMENL